MMRQRKNIVGPQVRRLREERNWTLHQLAVELALHGVFISADTLKRIELRREFVGTFEISTFAAVFKIRPEHLFPPDVSAAELAEILRVLQKNGAENRSAPHDERQRAN